jgi:DNA-binding Xre family transcriptional regulator
MALRFAVKEIALAKGFRNARHLAAEAKVSFTTMYEIWDNKKQYVHLRVLERLAEALEVPAGMLLTDKPEVSDREPARRRQSELRAGEGAK